MAATAADADASYAEAIAWAARKWPAPAWLKEAAVAQNTRLMCGETVSLTRKKVLAKSARLGALRAAATDAIWEAVVAAVPPDLWRGGHFSGACDPESEVLVCVQGTMPDVVADAVRARVPCLVEWRSSPAVQNQLVSLPPSTSFLFRIF